MFTFFSFCMVSFDAIIILINEIKISKYEYIYNKVLLYGFIYG